MRTRAVLLLASPILVLTLVASTRLAGATPIVSDLSTSTAPPSGRFLVTGTGFGATRGTSHVEIGATVAFVTRWSDTSITVFVPGLTPEGPTTVRVVTTAGASNSLPFGVVGSPGADGRVAWRFQADAPYVLHRQAVAPDGTVYLQDIRGFLYALDEGGGLLWIYDAAGYPSGGGGEGPVALLGDGTIVVVGNPLGADVEIHGVHPDGTRRWVFTDTNTQGVIAGPSVGPDGNVYFVTDFGGRGLVSLSPAGELLWSDAGSPTFLEYGQLGEEIAFGPSGPQGTADRLYVAFDEFGQGGGDRLYSFTLDGDQRFAVPSGAQSDPLGQRQGQPAVGPDGTVYLCASITGWRLAAYRASDGTRLWEHFPAGTNVLTEPDVGPDGTIYVGRNLGELHAVRPDGTERWSRSTGEIFFGPVASPANDVVLAGGRVTYGAPGWVKALSAADGSVLWTVDLPSEGGFAMIPFSRPTFVPDGRRAYITTTLPGQPSGEEYCYLYAIDVQQPVTTSVDAAPGAANGIAAVPNPFRVATEISFAAPRREAVALRIVDVAGRVVRHLHTGDVAEGVHRFLWDGRDDAGRSTGSGIYFVRLESQARSASVRVVRMR